MNNRTCTIGEVRFSYLKVFAPNDGDIDNGKYTVSILIPKKDTNSINTIKACLKACYEENTDKLGKDPHKVKYCLNDGDLKEDETYHGHYYINAKSKVQPGIVNAQRQQILDSREFISGDYGYACITFFAYLNAGNKGVGCAIRHLMKTRDGEPLAEALTAEDAFANVPNIPAPAPQYTPLTGFDTEGPVQAPDPWDI